MMKKTIAACILVAGLSSPALAAGLNTDVALTPPKGGTILRGQTRYIRLHNDPTALGREVDLYLGTVTAVYGVTERLALLGTLRAFHREVDFAAGGGPVDTGLGDIPLLAKYRFFQKDERGVTTRWALLGGFEVPTFDDTFSSKSLDPIVGTVWTHQELDWWVDWDLVYKVNTAGGGAGDDELRADIAYSRRILHGEGGEKGPWALYVVAELNAKYITDASLEVLGSPGIQYITPRTILEAGIQLPLVSDMAAPRLETQVAVVFSIRIQF